MEFIAPEKAPENADIITNSGFWPEIDLGHYRRAMRQDGTVTAERLKEAALTAISEVNAELFGFKQQKLQEGVGSLQDVPAEKIGGMSSRVYFYRRAVYCQIKAEVSERYPDIDTTKSGQEKAEPLAAMIDELRRDAQWAMQRLRDMAHMTVELI